MEARWLLPFLRPNKPMKRARRVHRGQMGASAAIAPVLLSSVVRPRRLSAEPLGLGGHPKPAINGHLKTGQLAGWLETLTTARRLCSCAGMSNVLSDEKQQQVLALGRLGWSLRRIEEATGVRRETASGYLKAAGIPVRAPRTRRLPSKPASQVSTDSGPGQNRPVRCPPTLAGRGAVRPGRAPSASACEPYREVIEEALGRAAMRWPSGRTWSTTTASRPATPASGASCASCGADAAARRAA